MTEIKKKGLVIAGLFFFFLGLIGIFIPLLPTTPFLLLSATCFFRGSEKLYQWLLNHRIFGEYIRNFREHRAIPLKTKVLAITLLWITIILSVLFFTELLILDVVLIMIAIGVSIHILHFKTLEKDIS